MGVFTVQAIYISIFAIVSSRWCYGTSQTRSVRTAGTHRFIFT